MQIVTITGGYDANLCYLAAADGSDEAVLIDASAPAAPILEALERQRWRLACLAITHSHADHIVSAAEILHATGARLAAWHASPVFERLEARAAEPLDDRSLLQVGPLRLEALYTPGHADDHLCYYAASERVLFTGDVLFVGRPGRTASAGQDPRRLYRSLRDRIAPLPGEVRFYPGHDYGEVPNRTLAEERRHNRWLQAADEDAFVRVCEAYEASRARR